MGFYIVLPQATQNLHKNPSGEVDTTGYTSSGSGASVARSSEAAYRGAYSIKCFSGSTNAGGCFYGTVQLTAGGVYTFSAYVNGQVGQAYKIYIANTSGTELATKTFVGTGEWQRVEVSYTETSTASRRFYITKNGGSATSTAMYIDACQIENLGYATTYCDGDQEGCKWVGGAMGAHKSVSARSGMSRAGGRKVYLTAYNAFLVGQTGTGMAPMKNSSVAYGNGPGAFWRGQLATERSFTIAFSVSGNGVPEWHGRRQALIDAIKPDLVSPQQDFILGYDDGGEEIEIRCHYDSGFEMADGTKDIETLPLKVIASDPYWYKTKDESYWIDNPSRMVSGSSAYAVFRDSTGNWILPDGTGPTGGKVNVVKPGPDGNWYFGGAFTSCGGVSNTAYFAKYDPSTDTFSSMGTFNGEVTDFTWDMNGLIVVVGKFTTVNGNAWPYVVKHNGSSFQQIASSAPNNYVTAVCITGNNVHYFFGAMTGGTWGAGGSFSCVFSPDFMSTGLSGGFWGNWVSFNAIPVGVAVKQNTMQMLVYGPFTVPNAAGLYLINGYTSTLTNLGQPAGTTGGCIAAVVSRDGSTIYAVYKSTTVVPAGDLNAGNTYHLVLAHNGSGWVEVGRGNGIIDYLNIDPINDDLYVSCNRPSGSPTISGLRTMNGIFTFHAPIYTGNRWVHGQTMTIWSGVAFDELGNQCYWFSTAGGNSGGYDNYSVKATITNNGSAEVQPDIVCTGYGRFMVARNWTTGATLYGNLQSYQFEGEKTIIDTSLGLVSSNRRPVFNGVLEPNSDLGRFTLVPGDNEIEVWFEYYTLGAERNGIDLWFQWREKHWSIDGGAPS